MLTVRFFRFDGWMSSLSDPARATATAVTSPSLGNGVGDDERVRARHGEGADHDVGASSACATTAANRSALCRLAAITDAKTACEY